MCKAPIHNKLNGLYKQKNKDKKVVSSMPFRLQDFSQNPSE